MKNFKRIISALLTVVIMLGVIPFSSLSASAAAYTINGVSVNKDSVPNAGYHQCWKYAWNMYVKIWKLKDYPGSPSSSGTIEDYLKPVKVKDLLMTAENAKKFISGAAPGANLRVCEKKYVTAGDNWGHSLIIVKITSTGFTTFDLITKSDKKETAQTREKTWTWESFAKSMNNSGYTHFKYIKWPNAPRYKENYVSLKLSTGNFDGGVSVTLASESGAMVYYTTNGKDPTTSSTKYTSPFKLTSTATVKALAVKSGKSSNRIESKINISKTTTPKIKTTETNKNFNVTISSESNAEIYYTTDGTNPTVSSKKYTSQFTVNENCTIKAIAVINGKALSEIASTNLVANLPSAPTVRFASGSTEDNAIGNEVFVEWDSVSGAYLYTAKLWKNGTVVEEKTTSGTKQAFIINEAGDYTITVSARNFVDDSLSSSPLAVTVHENSTVRFVDSDGTLLKEQQVGYGKTATAPTAPTKYGYDFARWDGNYTVVNCDVTITAIYTAKTYTVEFVGLDGLELKEETADFGSSVTPPPSPEREGFDFVGWRVKSGEGDSYENVNGDVVFEPYYVWNDSTLPITVKLDKAVRSTDAKSYEVEYSVTSNKDTQINAKAVVAIKTDNGKLVATQIDAITVPANASDYELNSIVNSTADGSLCEVYIVANDPENSNKTGGAYSSVATKEVVTGEEGTIYKWGEWSEWSETVYTQSDIINVESKTVSRYSDKQTTTSTDSTLEGWTNNGSTVQYGAWGSWSNWGTSEKTKTATRDVETNTVYRYYYFKCANCGYHSPYWDCNCKNCNHYLDDAGTDGYYFWTTTSYKNSSSTNVDGNKRKTTKVKGSEVWYFSSGNLNDTARGTYDAGGTKVVITKGYRTRTRSATTIYNYYKWSEWSEWEETPFIDSDTRKVESREEYRYQERYTVSNTANSAFHGNEDKSGTEYHIKGSLKNCSVDYSGKKATVMVYKNRNTDPTEDQLEYIGQIDIGDENTYEFSFIPKEEISVDTGDYVVSFGIATADGLVNNVEIIKAPLKQYNVVFMDTIGNIISSQSVESGSNAIEPDLPSIGGYDVMWDCSFVHITGDRIIRAIAKPKTFSIVFVDWVNNRTVSIDSCNFDDEIVFPADCSAEGKIFNGWSVSEGSTVEGTMVIEAQYSDIEHTAVFLNKDGSVFAEQKVTHGSAVILPETNPVAEGFSFICWSNDSRWWSVTEDITINPEFIFEQTVEAPILAINEKALIDEVELTLESSTESAEIRYTLDGSEPTEESLLFDEIVIIEETTNLNAKAFKKGMNSSSTIQQLVTVIPTEQLEKTIVSLVTDVEQYSIGEDSATICMRIDNPYGYEISSWGYVVTNEATGEEKIYENTSIAGTTDRTIGRVFTVRDLSANSDYVYYFFANFDELGKQTGDPGFFSTSVFDLTVDAPTTTITYGFSTTLHANVKGIKEGMTVVWESSSTCVSLAPSKDGTSCVVTSKTNGSAEITAKLVDADGLAVLNEDNDEVSATQIMNSNVNIFMKIKFFFVRLFGLSTVMSQILTGGVL